MNLGGGGGEAGSDTNIQSITILNTTEQQTLKWLRCFLKKEEGKKEGNIGTRAP